MVSLENYLYRYNSDVIKYIEYWYFSNVYYVICEKQCLCLQEGQVNLILFPGEIIKSLRTRNMAIWHNWGGAVNSRCGTCQRG